MEKKYMIFYYDVDEEGFPIPSYDTLQDVTDSLVKIFKSFLISYLNKILALERGEDI